MSRKQCIFCCCENRFWRDDIWAIIPSSRQIHNVKHHSTVALSFLKKYTVKSAIFWDVKSRSPLKVKRRFGGIYRLHLQGRSIRLTRSQQLAICFNAGFLRGLLIPKDGGGMFLRNVGLLSTDYTGLYPSNHRCENLKSYKRTAHLGFRSSVTDETKSKRSHVVLPGR
jgi:hypothetical protein